MKKHAYPCLIVLSLCGVLQPAHAALPEGLFWGPENGGLRMNLEIGPAEPNKPNVYKVKVRLANVSKSPIVLAAEWDSDWKKGDYREYLKQYLHLTTFPEVHVDGCQTADTRRSLPQPTIEVKPGESFAAEWLTNRRSIDRQGLDCEVMSFPDNGLYGIRGQFAAAMQGGRRVLLYSNDCQLAIGGSTQMPKVSVVHVIVAYPEKGTVLLDAGSDLKVEPNDVFVHNGIGTPAWRAVITEVQPLRSTARVSKVNPESKAPPVPPQGYEMWLIPATHHPTE